MNVYRGTKLYLCTPNIDWLYFYIFTNQGQEKIYSQPFLIFLLLDNFQLILKRDNSPFCS